MLALALLGFRPQSGPWMEVYARKKQTPEGEASASVYDRVMALIL